MSKYELSLTKDYVSGWGVLEGLRELYQNAVDQEVTDKTNVKEIKYNEDTQTLVIGNKNSILKPSSLLLGASTKQGDDKTIGQFGEGYKLALLVLTREGCKVTINNYGLGEVWDVKFVNSKRYSSDILTINTTKKKFWEKVPNNNLEMVIEGITKGMFEEFKETVYNYEGYDKEESETIFGNILLASDEGGKIYVNGLLVTTSEKFKYGYNIKPKFLEIGRDRNLVNEYAIGAITTDMWVLSDKEDDIKYELAKNDSYKDIQSFDGYSTHMYKLGYVEVQELKEKQEEFSNTVYNLYKDDVTGGESDSGVLVESFGDTKWSNTVSSSLNVKVETVPSGFKSIIEKSPNYKDDSKEVVTKLVTENPVGLLHSLVENELGYVADDVKSRLNELLVNLIPGYKEYSEEQAEIEKEKLYGLKGSDVPF